MVGVWPWGNVNAVRFLLNGENINPESTTDDINLDEENQIDCHLTSNLIVDEPLTICVQYKGEETMFKIKRTTTMNKVFAAFAARMGLEVTSREYSIFSYCSDIENGELIAEWITTSKFLSPVRFLLCGVTITPELTAVDMELENDDVIECYNESIVISVQYKGEATAIRIKRTTQMKKAFVAFATRVGLYAHNCEFRWNVVNCCRTSSSYCTFDRLRSSMDSALHA